MRYMLMMHVPGGHAEYQINNWAPEEFKAHIAFMQRFNQELTEAGEFVGAEGKASAAPGPGGEPLVIPIEVRQVMSAPCDQG
jgi:hypothetical protein